MPEIDSPALLISGIVLCFAGWFLFRVSIYFIALLLGTTVGYSLTVFIAAESGEKFIIANEIWLIAGLSLIFSIIAVILIKTLIKTIIFSGGFIFGALATSTVMGVYNKTIHSFNLHLILHNISIHAIVAGLIFGIIFIFFEKVFIVLYSVVVGALLIALSLDDNQYIFPAMILAGTAVQFALSRGRRVRNLKVE